MSSSLTQQPQSLNQILKNFNKIQCVSEEEADEHDRKVKESIEKSESDKIKSEQRRLFSAANIPKRHKKTKIEECTGEEWKHNHLRARQMIGNKSTMVFIGKRGAGKTQCAVMLLKRACEKLMNCRYTKYMDLLIDIKNSYSNPEETEREVIKKYVGYDLLAIDAFEVRSESDWEDRIINHIIDKRYDAMRSTIIISNDNDEQIYKSLGPSIVDRMSENGGILKFDWDSFRKPNSK